jgi:tetratricopeptide (TPR) repeat protein
LREKGVLMRRLRSFAGLLVLVGAIPGWGQQLKRAPLKESIIAFQDVSVIPMDTERVLPHQTVLVRNGKIVESGPADVVHLPPGSMLINGRSRFLVPGLADMHTHVDRKEMLPLFLAAGVTTVLNMGLASPEFVTSTREEIRKGSVVGPRVFAAFLIDGPGDPGPEYVPVCERDARAAVDRAKLEGYDFIKAYERLQPDIFATVLDEAKKQHIAVVGHLATAVGLESSLAQGQVMIAHAEEYYKTYFGHRPDDARIPSAVELTLRSGAYVTPNLSFFAALTRRTSDPKSFDERMAEPDIAFLPPDIRGDWLSDRPSKSSDRFVPELAILKKLTLALSKAGVPLLAGTDSPGGGMPGSSLDDDVEQLVVAGLTRFQALSAATRVPGQFIHQFVPGTDEFGTITSGASADLVLLAANPLIDIRNLREPLGVMVRGRWFDRQRLQAMVEKPVQGYRRVEQMNSAFQVAVEKNGAVDAISEFKVRAKLGDKLSESLVNALGYRMVNAHQFEAAIALFAFDTEQYPDSWNAYDSLGEAYADSGQSDLAIVSYRHSLALNPRNMGAFEFLSKAAMTPTASK